MSLCCKGTFFLIYTRKIATKAIFLFYKRYIYNVTLEQIADTDGDTCVQTLGIKLYTTSI